MSSPQCHVWYIDIDQVRDDQIESLSRRLHLSPEETARVISYKFIEDQKRSLLSYLLQYALICHAKNMKRSEFVIKRTKEGKPYIEYTHAQRDNFNFNVSHHGKFVCIASHNYLQIGVDLVDITTRTSLARTAGQYIDMFSTQFTMQEMETMNLEDTEEAKYSLFYINWSLKEAYVKALGVGLSCNLKFVHFIIRRSSSNHLSGSASLYVEGSRKDNFKCEFFNLDAKHVMSVVRGLVDSGSVVSTVEGTTTEEVVWENLPAAEARTVEALLAIAL